MPTPQVDHGVRDFGTCKRAFDSDPVGRAAGGARSNRISRLARDPDHVFVELDFESRAEAESFAEKLREMWSDAVERLGLESPTARVVEQVERVDY